MTYEFEKNLEWFNSSPLRFSQELRGKIVVLDFWTYCCINCMHVLPELASLEKKYANSPVVFIGVHSPKFSNEHDSENIRKAVLRYDIRHPVVNDKEMTLWNKLGVRSWPTLVLIGPEGELLAAFSGEGNEEAINNALSQFLKMYSSQLNPTPLPFSLEKEKEAPLKFPGKLAINSEHLFISDSSHHRIVITSLDGTVLETIGSGSPGLHDGSYTQATFNRLQGIAYYQDKLYVADAENHAIRQVDLKAKTVTTLAGNGTQGRDYRGGGKGKEQLLSTPWDIAVYPSKDCLFIAMAGTHQIWVYEFKTGRARNFSGTGAEQNLNSENALYACWAQPSGLTIGQDNLYIADSESSSIRMIDLIKHSTQTLVGADSLNPRNLFCFGDIEGKGDRARLQHPLGVIWWEKAKKIIVADTYNHRLKLLDPETNHIQAWVGSGKAGFSDGVGLEAQFYEPSGFALHPNNKHLFVADTNNHAIRLVNLETLKVTSF